MVRSAEHVGIGYIASYLRKYNFEVDIYEVTDIFDQEQYSGLLDKGYGLVGFTTTCITLKPILEMAKILKTYDPRINIVFGGHMATFTGTEILEKYMQVDYIIYGEGEITFLELAKKLENGDGMEAVKGVAYRDGEGIVRKNADRQLICDLDMLPYPARDQFETNQKNTQYIRISTSRGCYGSCAFCSSFAGRKQPGARWRGRSPANVVDEIKYLTEKYDFHTFDFVDSTFEDPGPIGKRRIQEIAERLIESGVHIYYNCCFRAENWKEEDRELLKLLVESGLEKVNIGFEAGNDRGLKILHKRARMKDNWRAIKVLKEFPEIYLTFGFIMLHPYSCNQDLYDNAQFLHRTGIGQVIRHYFWQLEVYPGTLMEEKLIKDGLLAKDYDIADGMYKYVFVHEEMNFFANAFKSLLELKSVWDFEIFDIVIHTFITRLRRKYRNTEIYCDIENFRMYVENVRKEIADYNFEFFIKLWEHKQGYHLEAEKCELDCFIREKIKIIKKHQYQLGHLILRTGRNLINR